MTDSIQKILLSAEQIHNRVSELATRIEQDYRDRELVIVAVLTGTVPFLADLIREIDLPLRLDFIGVSSYRDQTISGELVFTKELSLDVRNRHVLIVDDILDTGKTLHRVIEKVRSLGSVSIKTCVLLNKQARREVEIRADYVGFEIADEFVVGYGLDYAERFRNLPYIAVLKPD